MQDQTGLILKNTNHRWTQLPTKEEAYGLTWAWYKCDECEIKIVMEEGKDPNNERPIPCQQKKQKRRTLY